MCTVFTVHLKKYIIALGNVVRVECLVFTVSKFVDSDAVVLVYWLSYNCTNVDPNFLAFLFSIRLSWTWIEENGLRMFECDGKPNPMGHFKEERRRGTRRRNVKKLPEMSRAIAVGRMKLSEFPETLNPRTEKWFCIERQVKWFFFPPLCSTNMWGNIYLGTWVHISLHMYLRIQWIQRPSFRNLSDMVHHITKH